MMIRSRVLRRSPGISAWVLVLLLFAAHPARAHVGSKDVFETVQAGPYRLNVTVRMPVVIPGIATVEVQTDSATPQTLTIAPTPLTGDAAAHPPTPDAMKRDSGVDGGGDPHHFTGQIWIMARGSWQVHFHATGPAGTGDGSVPVAAVPLRVLPMGRALGWLLAALGLVLVLGFAGLVAAAVREGRLAPGRVPDAAQERRARRAFAAALAFAALVVVLGAKWWHAEAIGYAADIYKPSQMRLRFAPEHGGPNAMMLDLGQTDEKTGAWKPLDTAKLLLDHGKIMHLYAIRWPQMDAVYHLHPERSATGSLTETLPHMVPGTYKLFADIVQPGGFPETLTGTLIRDPGQTEQPLAVDDASATPPPLAAGPLGPAYRLPDGYTMVWRAPAEIVANRAYRFRFELLAPDGQPATNVVTYLGMAGHAAFVKTDGSVFAHTHPDGSAAMPAMMLANPGNMSMGDMGGMPTQEAATPTHATATIPASVEFPYGFPGPGRYRIFVQMKHGTTVETGVFDAKVS